jgi:hypothetical protein
VGLFLLLKFGEEGVASGCYISVPKVMMDLKLVCTRGHP